MILLLTLVERMQLLWTHSGDVVGIDNSFLLHYGIEMDREMVPGFLEQRDILKAWYDAGTVFVSKPIFTFRYMEFLILVS